METDLEKDAYLPVEAPGTSLVRLDPLQRYLAEIRRYPLLSREEEHALAVKVYEENDPDAALKLVTANLRLVVKIAMDFQSIWMQNLLDLVQEGNIGLMQAVKKFDPYKNVKFSYYAAFWIKAYIYRFIMANWRMVKIGTTQNQRKLFFKLKQEKQRLIDQGFDPQPKLLASRLGVSQDEVIEMDQRLDGWDVSLDQPVTDDSDTDRMDLVSLESESAEDRLAQMEIEQILQRKIGEFRAQLNEREQEIFEQRMLSDNPLTLQEIGDRHGVSKERIRQIENKLIQRLRAFIREEIPDFNPEDLFREEEK
jgi:RNA polymerase sigma-32 factor